VRGIYAIVDGKTMSEPPPQDLRGPTADDLRVKVFRDREHAGDWRVEKMDDDGGIELALCPQIRLWTQTSGDGGIGPGRNR
jgi:hypothetical protein